MVEKTKRRLLPILGALARPLLVFVAGAVGGEVLKGLGKKFAKYQRVCRHLLVSAHVKIARSYVRKIGPRRQRIRKIGPRNRRRRRQQASVGLGLSTAIDLDKKATESKLGKMMINDAKDYIPTACKKIKNKITNKNVKAVINRGVDDYVVNIRVELIGERFY